LFVVGCPIKPEMSFLGHLASLQGQGFLAVAGYFTSMKTNIFLLSLFSSTKGRPYESYQQ
jgi:hypothetical protein